MIGCGVIFTVRPWDRDDGDPAAPRRVLGVGVTRRLCLRADHDGALVALGDHRYALTGRTVAVGSASHLRRYVLERGHRPLNAGERRWLAEVSETLRHVRDARVGVGALLSSR